MAPFAIMAAMMGLQAANALVSSQDEASALRLQGRYQKMQADANARLSLMNADDSLKRGDYASGSIRKKASAIKGSQRVNAAAQGIDINSGSAADLQDETSLLAAHDIDMIKNNAWREAWGFKVQAQNYTNQGRMAQIGAKYGAKAARNAGVLNASSYAMKAAYYYNMDQSLATPEKGMMKEDGGTPKYDGKKVGDEDHTGSAGSGKGAFGYDPQDEPAEELAGSQYGQDWRDATGYSRSRENPLFPGHQLTDSWWRKYD